MIYFDVMPKWDAVSSRIAFIKHIQSFLRSNSKLNEFNPQISIQIFRTRSNPLSQSSAPSLVTTLSCNIIDSKKMLFSKKNAVAKHSMNLWNSTLTSHSCRSHKQFSYSSWGANTDRTTFSYIRQGSVFFLVASGAIFWTMHLVDLLAAWWMPEEYASIMGFDSEAEEERRTQRFYGVPPNLADDEYFIELSARHAALEELLARVETNQAIQAALGVSTAQGSSDKYAVTTSHASASTLSGGIEIVFLTDSSRLMQPAGPEPTSSSAQIWRPRIYLEGPTLAALATATFERATPPPVPGRARGRAGDDAARGWVPVALRITAIGEAPSSTADRVLMDARAPLPHGIRYSALRAPDEGDP